MNHTDTDAIEFSNNPEPRCPIVLLLDTSESMKADGRIEQLNAALVAFVEEMKADHLARLRVEIAIVSFGGRVEVVQEFAGVDRFAPPQLRADGATPMGQAIETGLNLIEQRKREYKTNGIAYFRPWMVLITDGEPTDEWQAAARRLHEELSLKKTTFFAVGVKGANQETLRLIASDKAFELHEQRFGELFQWLSASLSYVTRSLEVDETPLPAPVAWAGAWMKELAAPRQITTSIPPAELRLDAAVPETVAVNIPFDLAVAVRRSESPPLRVDELTRTRSGVAEVEWPEGVEWIDLRVHVHAPDCRIAGQPFQLFRLHIRRNSIPVYFSLTPLRVGDITIRVTLYQAFLVVGGARMLVQAGERVAGHVTTSVSSFIDAPHPGDGASGVYGLLLSAFSMEELATLSAGLGIDFDDLTGTTKQRKASELVGFCQRHGRVEELVAAIIEARPNWMELV